MPALKRGRCSSQCRWMRTRALFAATNIPLVSTLANAVGENATVAYADDVALMLRSMFELRAVLAVFRAYAATTGLQVKPSKRVLVPLKLEPGDFEATTQRYRGLLDEFAPEWSSFRIEPSATYLGMKVGPSASRRAQSELSLRVDLADGHTGGVQRLSDRQSLDGRSAAFQSQRAALRLDGIIERVAVGHDP